MPYYVATHGLHVARILHDFIEHEARPGTGVGKAEFWRGFSALAHRLAARNAQLLAERAALQARIDQWHEAHAETPAAPGAYAAFLRQIGYLQPEGKDFAIETANVDQELSRLAGPQLVVPLSNARFALNAANARWGSLYDALYGSDVIAPANGPVPADRPVPSGAPAVNGGYDPRRGHNVVAFARTFLDDTVPLQGGSYRDALGLEVERGSLVVRLTDGRGVGLASPSGFVGHAGPAEAPSAVLLVHHGLHIQILCDRTTRAGRDDPAGISDVLVEAALTTIMDCEDAVAAVDAEDKTALYRNWLGLTKGTLTETFTKNGASCARALRPDMEFTAADGTPLRLPGRSLLMIRNVGHLMTSDAVLLEDGSNIPEGILDAVVTSLIALHDLKGDVRFRNSRTGSIYIVKPKMHGPAEVAFAAELFDSTEDLLGLARNTIKLGLMDEERRTSVNLKECIRTVKSRIVFINTGFLDRTGDEIHTAMRAGPMVRKTEMKAAAWFKAYEDRNVAVGLACGFAGRAQIGKGMWAMPDRMADMVRAKIEHPMAGATTAWVPSPTAATLHALHYHKVDVAAQQAKLAATPPASVDALLYLPVADDPQWSDDDVRAELDNNLQGILGYVVRWVDHGIGCSKIPDIRNVGLMEDRATLRISSQHVANWLLHGIVTRDEVEAALERVARIVDHQNAHDPSYRPMAPAFDGTAFEVARALVLDGCRQPNGYADPLLHLARRRRKRGFNGLGVHRRARPDARQDERFAALETP